MSAAKLNVQYFTSSGSFLVPGGVTNIMLFGSGGGQGGGGGEFELGIESGGFGGDAAIQTTSNILVTPNTSYTITIGAGGTGGSNGTSGSNGGTTSFGTLYYTIGGGNFSAFGPLGAGQGGTPGPGENDSGFSGNYPYVFITGSFAPGGGGAGGGASPAGGGGGGGGGAGSQGSGGRGGDGGVTTGSNGGSAAANTGAGGGGGGGASTTRGTGGNGGSGYLYVIWVE